MKFKFFPHTADVKFKAYGKTLEEAFANSALALTTVITDPKKIEPKVKKIIEVSSEDEEALLYDFLEKFLILLDSENFLLNSVKKIKIKDLKLKAEIVGDTDLTKYSTSGSIKAVTYQQMEIKKEKGRFILQVILDI